MKATHFMFNKIYLIESISNYRAEDNDLAIGAKLEKRISKKIDELKNIDSKYDSLSCELIKIDGRQQWEITMHKIEKEAQSGKYPIIHFICHGSYDSVTGTSCMYLADSTVSQFYTSIQWVDVARALERINIACHNNLMVTMCVCYGFCSLGNIFDDRHRIPYWCLLSKSKPVTLEEGLEMADFYISLIQNLNIEEALKNLHGVLYNDETEETDKLKFSTADYLFEHFIRKEFKLREDAKYMEKEAWKVYNQKHLSLYWPWEWFLPAYKGIYAIEHNKIYKEISNYKFMFDIYPEEKERFDLPETYDELMRADVL